MRETDIENKLLALFSGTVTYAVDFKLLLVALADAGHHVGDECAGKTVKGLVELGVVGALDMNGRAFDFDSHIAVHGSGKLAFGTLNGDSAAVHLHSNPCGDCDGFVSYA